MRVHLFIPCLIDQFHPETGWSVSRILKRVCSAVVYPQEQICCGQPLFKAGQWKRTLALARNTIRAFRTADLVVGPSGSCVNMIRNHYLELFRDDPVWLERAQDLGGRIYEFSEFLVNLANVDDLGASCKAKVTYHDSCQVYRGLGVTSEPRRLLGKVRGLRLVEMENPDRCCGFGGVFSYKLPHIAQAMADEKIESIAATGVEAVVGCEISCLMHMAQRLAEGKTGIKTLHLADVLAGRV